MTSDRNAIRQMYAEGIHPDRIAQAQDCSTRTVYRALESVRPKRKHYPPPSPETLATAREMLEDRAGYSEVARTLSINWHTLKRHLPGFALSRQETGQRRQVIGGFNGLKL